MTYSFDPGGCFLRRMLVLMCFLVFGIGASSGKRLKRGLEHLDVDVDVKHEYEFTGVSGIDINSTHDEYSRAFLHMRHMLVSLACYDYAQSSNRNCPYNQLRYFKALRNYGCNCYPQNFDTVNVHTGGTLWVLGQNGHGIDEVDLACQNAYHRYQCYEMDGCFKGSAYDYHIDENGQLQCGPTGDIDYASDPERFRCELGACRIERVLAESLYPLIGFPDTFRAINGGNYFAWRNEERCVHHEHPGRGSGGPNKKTQCCGEYPKRRTYNPNKFECCTDGKIRPHGFC